MIAFSAAAFAASLDLRVQGAPVQAGSSALAWEQDDGSWVAGDPVAVLPFGLAVGFRPGEGGIRGLAGGGVDLTRSWWAREPLDFGVTVVEPFLRGGLAVSQGEGAVRSWFELAVDLHLALVLPDWFGDAWTLYPGAWFAGGVSFGEGSLRPEVGLGLLAAGGPSDGAGEARLSGETQATGADFKWTYTGRIALLVQVGLSWDVPKGG